MMTRSMSRIAELEARIAELEKENAKLKKENEWLDYEPDIGMPGFEDDFGPKLIKAELRFLDKYLVPNYFWKQCFERSSEWSDFKWKQFKKYVINWACKGELNEIMEELMDNFIKEREEDTDDEDESSATRCSVS